MLVANSFDLWQKDAFFSAAEEVQESADIMESAYRTWVRERRERLSPENLEELSRELQTALGTAKWQLEEFERAVRLSYGNRGEDNSTARHSQFISAIESQISRVESALRESFQEEGNRPLRWVNLDEEERDDLAAFLSGTSQISQSTRDEIELETGKEIFRDDNHTNRNKTSLQSSASSKRVTYDINSLKEEVTTTNKNENYAVEHERKDVLGSRDDIVIHVDRITNTRRTWNTPNVGELRIAINEEDGQRNESMSEFEDTPKEKRSRFVIWKKRCGELSRANGTTNLFNQLFGRAIGSHGQLHSPPHTQYIWPIQVTLALMLTIFLIVPFLVYTN